jgi:hypothetical protein
MKSSSAYADTSPTNAAHAMRTTAKRIPVQFQSVLGLQVGKWVLLMNMGVGIFLQIMRPCRQLFILREMQPQIRPSVIHVGFYRHINGTGLISGSRNTGVRIRIRPLVCKLSYRRLRSKNVVPFYTTIKVEDMSRRHGFDDHSVVTRGEGGSAGPGVT